MSQQGAERRRNPRYRCSAPVEVEWGSEILRFTASDISTSGMFVATENPLWMRAEFTARILADEPVPVECTVRRVEPGRGMGLEFGTPSPETQKALDALLWKLAGK